MITFGEKVMDFIDERKLSVLHSSANHPKQMSVTHHWTNEAEVRLNEWFRENFDVFFNEIDKEADAPKEAPDGN